MPSPAPPRSASSPTAGSRDASPSDVTAATDPSASLPGDSRSEEAPASSPQRSSSDTSEQLRERLRAEQTRDDADPPLDPDQRYLDPARAAATRVLTLERASEELAAEVRAGAVTLATLLRAVERSFCVEEGAVPPRGDVSDALEQRDRDASERLRQLLQDSCTGAPPSGVLLALALDRLGVTKDTAAELAHHLLLLGAPDRRELASTSPSATLLDALALWDQLGRRYGFVELAQRVDSTARACHWLSALSAVLIERIAILEARARLPDAGAPPSDLAILSERRFELLEDRLRSALGVADMLRADLSRVEEEAAHAKRLAADADALRAWSGRTAIGLRDRRAGAASGSSSDTGASPGRTRLRRQSFDSVHAPAPPERVVNTIEVELDDGGVWSGTSDDVASLLRHVDSQAETISDLRTKLLAAETAIDEETAEKLARFCWDEGVGTGSVEALIGLIKAFAMNDPSYILAGTRIVALASGSAPTGKASKGRSTSGFDFGRDLEPSVTRTGSEHSAAAGSKAAIELLDSSADEDVELKLTSPRKRARAAATAARDRMVAARMVEVMPDVCALAPDTTVESVPSKRRKVSSGASESRRAGRSSARGSLFGSDDESAASPEPSVASDPEPDPATDEEADTRGSVTPSTPRSHKSSRSTTASSTRRPPTPSIKRNGIRVLKHDKSSPYAMLGLAEGLEDATRSPSKLGPVPDIPKAVVHEFGPFDLARYTRIPVCPQQTAGTAHVFRAVPHPFELGKVCCRSTTVEYRSMKARQRTEVSGFRTQCVGNQTLFFPNYELVRTTGGGFVEDVYGPSGVQDLLEMLEVRPWDSMWTDRVRHFFLVDPNALSAVQVDWLLDYFKFMFTFRQAIWARTHWFYLPADDAEEKKKKKRSSPDDQVRARNVDARLRDLHRRRRSLDNALMAALAQLLQKAPAGMDALILSEPALWHIPARPCPWLLTDPQAAGGVPLDRQLKEVDQLEPIRTFFASAPARFVEALIPEQLPLLHSHRGTCFEVPVPWDRADYAPLPYSEATVGTPGPSFERSGADLI
ncbi:hypothetical protein PINS_up016070 [Pythium insidiosum]|nr:hypothetical protein PINS_up016070 [Pythium insidiosum]